MRPRKELWDPSHPHYLKREKMLSAWQDTFNYMKNHLPEEMAAEKVDLDYLKTMWQRLRDDWQKKVREYKSAGVSSSAREDCDIKPFTFYQDLSFLSKRPQNNLPTVTSSACNLAAPGPSGCSLVPPPSRCTLATPAKRSKPPTKHPLQIDSDASDEENPASIHSWQGDNLVVPASEAENPEDVNSMFEVPFEGIRQSDVIVDPTSEALFSVPLAAGDNHGSWSIGNERKKVERQRTSHNVFKQR